MPFFLKRKPGQNLKPVKSLVKRKKVDVKAAKEQKKRAKYTGEEIGSDSDIDGQQVEERDIDDIPLEERETAQERKLRLTKDYLAQLEIEEARKQQSADIDKDAVSHRLKQDLLEKSGKVQKRIADTLQEPNIDDVRILRGHNLSITCLVVSPDDKYIYSGSKDCSIIKWSVETGRKVKVMPGGRKGTEKTHVGHTTHILCMAISSDNMFLATGGRSMSILIWDPAELTFLHKFKGHRDAISGLSFRHKTHQLFSASHDRSLRVWNLDEMAFVEDLFGHQDIVTSIDSLAGDRAISVGGRDRSVRVWKIVEESQLVYSGHKGSIDCVSLINEQNFVTGGDDNCLLLWNVGRKRPTFTRANAHGLTTDNWISALCAMTYTDLIASGSHNGQVKFWKSCRNGTNLYHLFSLPITGFVNSIKFSNDRSFMVLGIGQEHRAGRWWRMKEAKNSLAIVKLAYKDVENVDKAPEKTVVSEVHGEKIDIFSKKSSVPEIHGDDF